MSTRRRLTAPRNGRRRHRGEDDDGVELTMILTNATELSLTSNVFNGDSMQQKIDLARLCWLKLPIVGQDSLTGANDSAASIMRTMVTNTYRPADRDAYDLNQEVKIESILSTLVRMKSQKNVTLLTARVSVAAYRYQLPLNFWRLIHSLAPGLLASVTWTDELISLAIQFRPPCDYKVLDGVGGVCFDNYQRRCQYKSQCTIDSAGNLLGMTNWATVEIPAELAPPNFNALEICTLSSNSP